MKRNISLSFVIPVYNESLRLSKTFKALKAFRMPKGLILEEVIFVNDGSTDTTKFQIEKQTKIKVKLVSYKQNMGKGYAIRKGMLASKSDYTLFFDADMSTPLSELKKFVPGMQKGLDVVIGTRKNGHSTVVVHQPLYRELLGKCFTLLSQVILNTWVTDFTCGFKAFSKEATQAIFPVAAINRWGYDSELLFLARIRRLSMIEVPVKWSDDRGTKVKLFTAVFTSLSELITIRKNDLTGVYADKETSASPALA